MSWIKVEIPVNGLENKYTILRTLYNIDKLSEEAITYASEGRILKVEKVFEVREVDLETGIERRLTPIDVVRLSSSKEKIFFFTITIKYYKKGYERKEGLRADKYLLKIVLEEDKVLMLVRHREGLCRTLEEDILEKLERKILLALSNKRAVGDGGKNHF